MFLTVPLPLSPLTVCTGHLISNHAVIILHHSICCISLVTVYLCLSTPQMMDMFFFMFLLSIWVVAYGVAKQAILIHNEDRLDWIVRGAVYEPYLIICGNVPSNIDSECQKTALFLFL